MNDNDFKSKKNVLKGGNYWQKEFSFGSIVQKKPKSIDERFVKTANQALSSFAGKKLDINLSNRAKLTIGRFGAISAGEPRGKSTPLYGAEIKWKF